MESAAVIDSILNEKQELERALIEVRDMLERERDEKLQVDRLYQDQKSECERVKVERSHYQQRLMEEFGNKKELEAQYESRMSDWRRALETKQKELDSIAQKMVLPIDTDILRMRVTKDIEARFRLDIETKTLEVEKMTEAYYETKRQFELVKTSMENHKYESEKIIQEMREKHKSELSEIYEENHSLQLRIEEQRDKDTVRQVRRDLEEYKKRYSDCNIEVCELRKERDALKLEKNDLIIKQAKEIEDERNLRRMQNTEGEKLKFRVKCLEDDLQKQFLKADKRSQEATSATQDKTSLLSLLKEKEILLDSMKRQLNEAREDLHQREAELEKLMRRQGEEDRERGAMERKEKSKLQKELEVIEKNYAELENTRKRDVMLAQEEYEKLQKRHRVVTEERNIYLQQLQKMQTDLEEVHSRLDQKSDEYDLMEREYKKLQDKHRETLNNEYALQTAKEHLEASIRMMQEDVQRFNADYEEQMAHSKHDRGEMAQRYSDVARGYEKAKDDFADQRNKVKQYKEKLRLANSAIKTLSSKIFQYESEKNGSGAAHPSGGHATLSEDHIRVGGINIDGGRDSNNSGRDSEVNMQAIQKVIQDEKIKKLFKQ